MATALLTINADARNALNTINQLQNALNNLQNNANLILGGRGNNLGNQFNQWNRGIAELNSLTNAWAATITRSVTSALKTAYNEIKNIDDELVTIRRVTGRTGAELDALTARATDVAKTYGTAASDYLKSVSSFSKAGYGEAADYLGELSVKAQRVGDLTQEVADQFLLAVDKGYQFNGSIEQLSAVLDGANEIGNRFATDIDKIAAGLGKVAPIAAQAHVSIYELEAALGTITAVTQRSGTEAATALRALFLNIMGDTKTEIEDGATWTAGEIEGLQDLLKIYASDVVEAAQKTGEVINPMEAIAALSKAFREGVLTEQALVSMVSDIGGKLRTTQLLALIQNWDMYTAMVNTATTATGSADKEIENSLDSITVKLNQLKATWVDMVSDTINSRFIKDMIDFATQALTSFGGLVPVLTNIAGIVLTLRGYRIGETIRSLFANLHGGGIAGFISWVGVATTVVSGLIAVFNKLKQANAQEIAGLIDTAAEAEKTSDSIYDLYMKVVDAVPGTDEYTSALARLAAQMGLTGEEAANLAGNVDEATLSMLQKAQATAANAYKELGFSFSDPNWIHNANIDLNSVASAVAGTYDFDISTESRAIADAVRKHLAIINRGGTRYGLLKDNSGVLGTNLLKTIGFNDADELIQTYEALQATYNELASLADESIISSPVYQDITSMMSVLKDSYTQAKEALDSVVSTAANTKNAELQMSSFANTWHELNEEIAGGGAISETERQAAISGMMAFVDTINNDATLTPLAKDLVKNSVIRSLADQFPELIAYIEEWQDVISSTPENGVAETAEEASDSIKQLTDAITEATRAKSEFDKAMEAEVENESFQNYKEAYETYAQEIEEGRVNSRRAKAAAKYLLGNEVYNAAYANGGYKGVNAAMSSSNLGLLYGEESGDYAEGFFKFLTKYANQAGEIVDANGQIIASLTNVGEAVSFHIGSIEELSKVTGLSIGQIGAAADALSVYGDVYFEEIETLKTFIQDLQGVTEGENGVFNIDYDAFKSQFDYSDFLSEEWQQIKDVLYLANELGKVNLTNVTEGWYEADDAMERAAETAKSDMEEQKAAAESAKTEAQALAEEAEATAQAAREAAAGVQSEMQAIAEASTEAQTQIASINEVLATIKATLGEEAAALFLHSLKNAASDAGADITVTEGAITELKGVGGQPMSWEMLNSLISTAGDCTSALSEIGGKIDGFKDIPTIEITANGDGATTVIETVAKTADDNTVKRTIEIGAEGITAEFETVKNDAGKIVTDTQKFQYGAELGQTWETEKSQIISSAEGVTKTTYNFTYGINGELETTNKTTVQESAKGVTKDTILFKYGIDGTLDTANKQTVIESASGVTKETTFNFKYGIDSTLDTANKATLYTDASGVTTGVEYNFKYGTDGSLIESSKANIRTTADGVVDKTIRKFKYGADGKPLEEELVNVKATANGVTSQDTDKRVFYYTANGDRIPVSASLIKESANSYAEETIYFKYDAQWNPDGYTVAQITQDADGVLKERIVEFDANGNPVSETVEALTGKVTGLARTDPYMIKFQTDGEKVLSTIGEIEDAIKKAQKAASGGTASLVTGSSEPVGETYGPPLPPSWGGNDGVVDGGSSSGHYIDTTTGGMP